MEKDERCSRSLTLCGSSFKICEKRERGLLLKNPLHFVFDTEGEGWLVICSDLQIR